MLPSSRRRLVLLCCLAVGLAVSLGAAATVVADAGLATGQPVATEGLDLPERLDATSVDAEGVASVRTDAGAAVHRDGAALDAAYDRLLLEHRLEAAETDAERRAVLEDSLNATNETALALRERERTARRDYAAGAIDEAEFLAELRSVHERSERELTTLDAVEELAEDYDVGGVESRTTVYRAQLQVRQGGARASISETAAGDGQPHQVFVAAGHNDTVLAGVEGDDYYREANNDDHHVGLSDGSEPLTRELGQELYPSFVEEHNFHTLSEAGTNGHLYRALGDYDHGTLASYIDASTGDVIREDQRLRLGPSLPTRDPIRTSEGPLELQVNRTYPSGPAQITIRDADGAYEDAEVTVDGERVGTTDENGQLWIVLPYGEPTVEATVHGSVLELQVGASTPGSDSGPTPQAAS